MKRLKSTMLNFAVRFIDHHFSWHTHTQRAARLGRRRARRRRVHGDAGLADAQAPLPVAVRAPRHLVETVVEVVWNMQRCSLLFIKLNTLSITRLHRHFLNCYYSQTSVFFLSCWYLLSDNFTITKIQQLQHVSDQCWMVGNSFLANWISLAVFLIT